MTSDADRIIDIYRRHAGAWTQARGDWLFETAWLDRFLGLAAPDLPILDLGCGCGKPIARYLMEQGRTITGIDGSPEMIAMAQGHFPVDDWRVADMRTLSLDRTFAGILAWDSFFHLSPDDQRGMFPIFGAHAAPGAPLMFTSGPRFGVAMGVLEGEPLYHASLDPEEYRALLSDNGFVEQAHVVEDPTCGNRTIWLAQQA